MQKQDIQITFVGMDATQAIKDYCIEKISKYEHLWKEATSIEVTLKEYVNSRGVKNDFRVDINVKLPNSLVRVEVSGEDMYANVDEATDTMARRLKRYHERRSYWEGATPWRVFEADALAGDLEEEVGVVDYANYTPKIAVRKKLEDLSPIEEAEAIERMELSGYDQIMFRNRSTGKLSMIYRREQGGYGLVEPGDTPLD